MKIKKHVVSIVIIAFFMMIFSKDVQASTLKITTDTLNLRKEASTSSDILTLLSKGEECEVLDTTGDWYKVKYKTYTGYVSKEYVKLSEDTQKNTDNQIIEDNEVVTETTLNEEIDNEVETNEATNKISKINEKTDARILPLVNSSVIANLKKDTQVTVINELNGWAYIQTDSINAWIRSEKISTAEETSTTTNSSTTPKEETPSNDTSDNNDDTKFKEKEMYVNDSYVNLRKEASTSSEVVMVVSLNTKLTVIGEEDDWYKVKTSVGNAYVSKKLLSTNKVTNTSRGGTIVRGATENIDISELENSKKEVETKKQVDTSTPTSTKQEQIVNYAKSFLGVPYVYGGASPSGFDCSGFTMYVYKKIGISMGHGAQAQARLGKAISADKTSASSLKENLKPGDLVFFLDYQTMDEIGHCGIYIGNGEFIHASSGAGYCVKISSLLPGQAYNKRYCAARRII